MVIKRESGEGVSIKIKRKKSLLILLSLLLLIVILLVIFFFTNLFANYRDKFYLQLYDQGILEDELTDEDLESLKAQQVENQKGYRIVKAMDTRDDSITPLLSLEELSIRGYEVKEGVISFDMIWHRVDGDISFTTSADRFILNEISYDSEGDPEIVSTTEVDLSSDLDSLLSEGLIYSGNFAVQEDDLTEELVEEYIEGGKEMEVKLVHLAKLPGE